MEYADNQLWGFMAMGDLCRGSGTEPLDGGEFSKICKIFLNKIAKIKLYKPIFQNSKNPALSVRMFGQDLQLIEKFLKILDQNSIEKLNC